MKSLLTTAVLAASISNLYCSELTKSAKIAKAYESLEGFNEIVESTLKEYAPSGIAIAVVVEGEVILSKGYGMANLEKETLLTPSHVMPMGSITQTFTSALVGYAEEKKWLNWDDTVIKHLSTFRLNDRELTYRTTILDLMCHRTGLPPCDLLWMSKNATKEEMIGKLHHFKTTYTFRAHYQNNNILMLPVAAILEKHAGKSYEQLTQSTLLQPIGMTSTTFTPAKENLTKGYSYKGDSPKTISMPDLSSIRPALGIYSNLEDMTAWVKFQLDKGLSGTERILSTETMKTIHTGQLAYSEGNKNYPDSNAIINKVISPGWVSKSYRGRYHIHHEAYVDGFSHFVSFLPFDRIGIVVLSNCNNSELPKTLGYTIVDKLFRLKTTKWLGKLALKKKHLEKQTLVQAPTSHPLLDFVGSYWNEALGEVRIELKEDSLIAFYNDIEIPLHHEHYDIFMPADDCASKVFEGLRFSFSNSTSGNIHKLAIPITESNSELTFVKK